MLIVKTFRGEAVPVADFRFLCSMRDLLEKQAKISIQKSLSTMGQMSDIVTTKRIQEEMAFMELPSVANRSSPPDSEESALEWDISLSFGSHKQDQPSTDGPVLLALASGGGHPPHSENNAIYFLWPPVYRSHGSAEERSTYFKGLQKSVTFRSRERLPTGQQASTLLDLMTIRAYNSKQLRAVSLGTAVGFRMKKGIMTNIPAIIVFVAHKIHENWLDEKQRLPMFLEGPGGIWCDVDVVELFYYGTPTFTPKEQVHTELVEGLRGNYPFIGPGSQVATQETFGTLGAIVRSKTGARQFGFLTNRHVAVDLDYPSQKMFHPLPPNCGPGVYVGAVERATSFIPDEGWYSIFASMNPETFVRADGAFIPFADSFDLTRVRTSVKGVGEMGDVIAIDLQAPVGSIVGKQVVKVGRSSGLTKGSIMAYALEYNDEKGICYFTDFLIVGEQNQRFDLEGDSGSLILMMDENGKKPRPVGMIWGGTANRGRLKLHHGYGPEYWTSGVDLGRLLEWLQLDLVSNDAELREAIDEQRQLSMVETCMLQECSSRFYGNDRSVEVHHKFTRFWKQNQSHQKQLGQGSAFQYEEEMRVQEIHASTLAGPSKADGMPINYIEERDFLQGVEKNSDQVNSQGLGAPRKAVNEDACFGLHLYHKDSKRQCQ